jgi:CheY-like chemotaxis protein
MASGLAVLAPDRGNLLVVDDEPFLRDAVAASLRFLGFDVTTAKNGPTRCGWPATIRSTSLSST